MYKEFIDPVLMRLDSETWHTRAREALHLAEATPFTLKLLEQFADHYRRFTDERLYDFAAYFAINVSSPNTPGLRALQDKKPLTDIVQAVNETMDSMGGRKPLFVKIAPELSPGAIDDVIEVVLDNGLTGIIATNTTVNPDIKAKYGERWRNEAGGLSGNDPDYQRMATEKVAHIYRQTKGKIDIIGVGGVKDA